MRRYTRALAGAAGIAAVALLSGCDKPTPKVSAYGGGQVVTVSPTSYCFSADRCRTGPLDLPKLTVAPDEKVLIDVPRALDTDGWRVVALSLDGTQSYGSSGTITGSHTYRVVSSAADGKPFIVQVNKMRGGKASGGTWSLVVAPSRSAS
jgi:hypothetical protein